MKTNLFIFFIIAAILGVFIVVTGCIKVLRKDGSIDLKAAGFILAGFIFVALPVIGSISFEWGELKVIVNTTNKETQALEATLDSLKNENIAIRNELPSIRENLSSYMNVAGPSHFAHQGNQQRINSILRSINNLESRANRAGSSIDSAITRNSKVRKDLEKFEGASWYKKQ
jgi:hypothetical protein